MKKLSSLIFEEKGLIFPEDLAKENFSREIFENLKKSSLISFE